MLFSEKKGKKKGTVPLNQGDCPLFFVAGCLAVATAVTLLAALLPARRAARLQVVQALQYE
jgi:hypothetical protein